MIVKVYLCGPMAECSDNEIHGWRDYVKSYESEGWLNCLDPTRRDYREVKIVYEVAKEIVEFDKIDINQSDVVLAKVDPKKSSVGTHQEIIYGWERGKEVLLVVPVGYNLSPWLIYHSQKVFYSLEDVIDYLRGKYG